ncbi:hypothetical protein [Marinobacterium jannaschii]|uniref:hypothetical protein n=1 Tax=Marinobacterium jannaschii TaxID=64970 RepID=UPI000481B789|nr:hypothetical protein [Marinobacterium jannaschii]
MESRSEPNPCDQEVKELLDALQRLKQELRDEISQLSLAPPEPAQDVNSGEDQPAAVSDCNRRLENVEQVMLDICQNNPGYCLSCSAAIPLMRLQSVPDTRYCAICEAGMGKDQSPR